ncbi:MAG: quinoprotein dehydrogenase-associated SoxYZ-like carrier [Rhodomicrobiaceae bacterium]
MLGNARLSKGRGAFRLVLTLIAAGLYSATGAQADQSEKSWKELHTSYFEGKAIQDGTALLALDAPYRADDPALVPVSVSILRQQDNGNRIKTLTLIVDENPAPIAATFTLAEDGGISAMETRLRVNAYSFVRAIAELADGSLHMVKRYVKATGGCAAPASRNPEDALASMGKMRLRQIPSVDKGNTFQLLIRHPNYSGLQMDQLTGHYRPAHFVNTIRISADDKPLVSVEGAISLSENPSLRFTSLAGKPNVLAAHAEDTEGNVFEKSWDLTKEPGDS